MYAVIETGGKQYTVAEGDVIEVELLQAEQNAPIEFQQVLLFSDGSNTQVGNPHVPGCLVLGQLLNKVAGPKINSLKYKPTQYKRFGHRQKYSQVEITEIRRA